MGSCRASPSISQRAHPDGWSPTPCCRAHPATRTLRRGPAALRMRQHRLCLAWSQHCSSAPRQLAVPSRGSSVPVQVCAALCSRSAASSLPLLVGYKNVKVKNSANRTPLDLASLTVFGKLDTVSCQSVYQSVSLGQLFSVISCQRRK